MKFTDEIISLILYPILIDGISKAQKEMIPVVFDEINTEKVDEIIKIKLTDNELSDIAKKTPENNRLKYFQISKSFADLSSITINQIFAFAQLGLLLKINEKDTGFTINIYDKDTVIDFEYHRTLINFSLVGSVIGFIPFLPVADFIILAPMQFGMVTKIANLYKYKIDSEQFVKMILGTLGTGFVFKSTARIINRFVPIFGWFVNATVAFAGTYAIGIIAKSYIEANGNLSKESIRDIWLKSYTEGKKEFSKFKDYIFEKKDELLNEFKKYKNNDDTLYSDDEDAEEEKESIFNEIKKEKRKKTAKSESVI
jgi:uncharacterized protein (DUF697 family)